MSSRCTLPFTLDWYYNNEASLGIFLYISTITGGNTEEENRNPPTPVFEDQGYIKQHQMPAADGLWAYFGIHS